MNAEEELKAYKLQAGKRARRASVTLILIVIVCVLFIVYGFTHSIEAWRQRDLAVQKMEEVIIVKEQLIDCQKSALEQQRFAQQALMEAEAAEQRAKIAVEECQKLTKRK